MKNIQVINHISISGEIFPSEELSESDRQMIAEKIQETMMKSAGYKRTPAS